ncbi:MAG: hypothetical protein ACFFFG_16995 [Candidatus Thorarchaeota archaeon]
MTSILISKGLDSLASVVLSEINRIHKDPRFNRKHTIILDDSNADQVNVRTEFFQFLLLDQIQSPHEGALKTEEGFRVEYEGREEYGKRIIPIFSLKLPQEAQQYFGSTLPHALTSSPKLAPLGLIKVQVHGIKFLTDVLNEKTNVPLLLSLYMSLYSNASNHYRGGYKFTWYWPSFPEDLLDSEFEWFDRLEERQNETPHLRRFVDRFTPCFSQHIKPHVGRLPYKGPMYDFFVTTPKKERVLAIVNHWANPTWLQAKEVHDLYHHYIDTGITIAEVQTILPQLVAAGYLDQNPKYAPPAYRIIPRQAAVLPTIPPDPQLRTKTYTFRL